MIGRNEPCHCGSGQKYKKCHLPLEQQNRDDLLSGQQRRVHEGDPDIVLFDGLRP